MVFWPSWWAEKEPERPLLNKERVDEIARECGGSYALAYDRLCEDAKDELPNVTWGGWFALQVGLIKEMKKLILEIKGGK